MKIQAYKRSGKVPVDRLLSVQALLDCGMDSFGSCHGGDARFAHKWIHENGIVDSTCNPYLAASPSWFSEILPCAKSQCHQCDIKGNCFVVHNPKKVFVEEYGTFDSGKPRQERVLDMMAEIYFRGPIVVSMWAHSPEFENYKGGYILRDNTVYTTTTHSVSIVGWSEQNGIKYWIVRNSFGTQWGENGFFNVERGANTFNIEVQGAWATPK